jgi:hypothetical protein
MNFHRQCVSLICAIFLLCLSTAARAQITYTYTGAPYTNYTWEINFINPVLLAGPFTPTPCPVTMSITLAAPLPPNFSGNVIPTNFSYSDCLDTINFLNLYEFTQAHFSTDANGKISSWAVAARGGASTPSFTFPYHGGLVSFIPPIVGDMGVSISTYSSNPYPGCANGCDMVSYDDGTSSFLIARCVRLQCRVQKRSFNRLGGKSGDAHPRALSAWI